MPLELVVGVETGGQDGSVSQSLGCTGGMLGLGGSQVSHGPIPQGL